MSERWLPVAGCEGYEISDLGRVRSWRRPGRAKQRLASVPHILEPGTHPDGYRQLWLSVEGIRTFRYVHHLVLEAFVGPCPSGMVTRHLDSDPSNNTLSNLVWDTQAENWQDQARRRTDTCWARNSLAKFSEEQITSIRQRLLEGERGSDLAREFGVAPSTITRIKYKVRYAGV